MRAWGVGWGVGGGRSLRSLEHSHRFDLASALIQCDEAAASAEGEEDAVTTLNMPHHTNLQHKQTHMSWACELMGRVARKDMHAG